MPETQKALGSTHHQYQLQDPGPHYVGLLRADESGINERELEEDAETVAAVVITEINQSINMRT